MWADLKDNKNKFYVAQALEDTNGQTYLWTRFGRVGITGVSNKELVSSSDLAAKEFLKKMKEKLRKGYNEIKMSLGKSSAPPPVVADPNDGAPVAPSKLDTNVQDFITLIFNKKLMEASVVKNGYDVKKMPLGELSKETVEKGYKLLQAIENVLNKKSNEDLITLTGQFYTNIPHCFGMQKMINFLIDTDDKLKDKMDLLRNLIAIQEALEMMKDGSKPKKILTKLDLKPNPLDNNFDQLKCKMETLNSQSAEYKMIDSFVQSGRGDYRKLRVVDAFKINRQGEEFYNP